MSYDGLLTMDATLHLRSPSTEDEHGDPTTVETDVATRCFVSRQTATEVGVEQTAAETFRLYLPFDAPLDGLDAVTVMAQRYEVDGPPWFVFNPRTVVVHHVEATLRRAD